MRVKNTDDFIKLAKLVHGDRYDYSRTVYVNTLTPVEIICPLHGKFLQTPKHHTSAKQGCARCWYDSLGERQTFSTEHFISLAQKCHGDTYDYSNTVYTGTKKPVTIICPVHGEFIQKKAIYHVRGHGCPKCGRDRIAESHRYSTETFIEKAKKSHPDYDYTDTVFLNSKTLVSVNCPKHGIFSQCPTGHLRGIGCPKCGSTQSTPEKELVDFIQKVCPTLIQRNRKIIPPYELDIFVPEKNIAIEHCGLYRHSTEFLHDFQRHGRKYSLCKEKGIRLITIFGDEWKSNRTLVEQKLLHIFGDNKTSKIMARKTTVEEILDKSIQNIFLNEYHIQGESGSSVTCVLRHNDEIVSMLCMVQRKPGLWEIVRFCSSQTVVGGFGKLLSHFKKSHDWKTIYTFADCRWSNGDVYLKAGMNAAGNIPPDYSYIVKNNTERAHKFGFRRKDLKRMYPDIYSEDKTEKQITEEVGLWRIYDCGKLRFSIENLGE